MAARDKILAYLAFSEYLRQRARNYARLIFDSMTVEDFFAEGMASDLVDLIFLKTRTDAFRAARRSNAYAVILGMEALSESELDIIIDDIVNRLHAETEPLIEAEIASAKDEIDAMGDEGVADETIAAILRSKVGKEGLMAGVIAVMVAAAAGLIATLERQVIVEASLNAAQEGPASESSFRWVTVQDRRVCDGGLLENSCSRRHGLEKTMPEWVKLGLPGAPNLLCSIFSRSGFSSCRCVLDAAPAEDIPTAVDSQEAIRSGRDRADAEAA
jgi:hypothetical protein